MNSQFQQLFYNTGFHPKVQTAIWTDIQNMRKEFPNILYSRFDSSPNSFVLLQGYVDFINRGQKCILPINMRLPGTFPKEPPIVELFFPPNFNFIPNAALQQNRRVNVNAFIQWKPYNTTLPVFLRSLVQFFQNYPPFNPNDNNIIKEWLNQFIHPNKNKPVVTGRILCSRIK